MANAKVSALTQRTTVDNSEDIHTPVGGADRRMKPRTLASALYPTPGSALTTMSISAALGAAGQALTVGSYYGVVFMAPAGAVYDRLMIEVTSPPGADGNIRFGVYEYDFATRLPVAGAPLYDSGNLAFTVAGMGTSGTPKLFTLGSGGVTVPASGVFYGILQTDTTMTIRKGIGHTFGLNYLPVANSLSNVMNNTAPAAGVTATGSFGAMPSSFSPALAASNAVPVLGLSKA